jgi:hypothetical protein
LAIPAGASAGWRFSLRHREQAFTLRLLALELAYSTDCLVAFPCLSLRGLFVKPLALHLAEKTVPLHSLFQYPESLFDVVVANVYLQNLVPSVAEKIGPLRLKVVCRM